MTLTLFSTTLVLLFIMDPIGNIASYLSLVKELPPKRQRWIIMREMLIALLVMIIFNYLGEYIFSFLGLSEPTVCIASGVILFLIAVKILFTSEDSPRAHLPQGEPFIFPLAVPLIAGPALLATIMLYARLDKSETIMLEAIILAWLISICVLYFAKPIQQVLRNNGLTACERLTGMVLVLIAVQRFLEGILLFWSTNTHSI